MTNEFINSPAGGLLINYPFPYEVTDPYNTGKFLGYLTRYKAIEDLIRSEPTLANLKKQYFPQTGAQARPSSSSGRTPRGSVAKFVEPAPGLLCDEIVQQLRKGLDARNGILGKRAGSQPPGSQPPAERPKPKAMPQTSFLRPAPPPIPDLLPPPFPPPEERPPPLPYEAHNEDSREEEEKEETIRNMEEEIEKKARELQEVAALGKESSPERQHVLATLDKLLPQIVDEYDSFFDPKRRKERLDAVAEFERNLKANGEEGLIAKHSRRDAKEKFLVQVGDELKQLREKEAEWIKKLIEPFESFMSGTDFDPIERLLEEYQLPEFLKKALWLSKGGSQPEYSEDGFAHANGAPNYTRILVKLV